MKSSVLETITRRLKISDPALAMRGYEDLLQATDRKPFHSIEGLRNVQRLMKLQNPAVAGLKTENLIDGKLMKELDESGFINQLYSIYGVNGDLAGPRFGLASTEKWPVAPFLIPDSSHPDSVCPDAKLITQKNLGKLEYRIRRKV